MSYEPSAAEVAWAAGLFEGEGCFTVTRSSYRKTGAVYAYGRAQLTTTDEDVLRRFAMIVGVGEVHGPYAVDGRKLKWTWAVARRDDFEHVAELLRPWLGARRRGKLAEVRASVSRPRKPSPRAYRHEVVR